ncbi:MAG TPA: 30S ribosomal protein S11 [Candidatus Paceibacterota bacterium]|jgi:small subunit ribosomal protein S11|nr:30S ribosomal protein S11 [Candidatus Paceibacterota bacterium]HPX52614.1 30S ribosomal protein S11 [Candidatus Paceibacterota bacterium]HQB57295.1 30S ribosomal protein S11 [Candidatus Paceibacterota bacterium]
MGKKRVVKKSGSGLDHALKNRALSKSVKRKLSEGILYVESTYNNTKLTLTDLSGNVIIWSTSGSLGFKGAKKGTPYAAGKIAEVIGEKASLAGVKEVKVIVNGVGSGREAAIRSFAAFGIDLTSIEDKTPVPHNGPKPKKPRRI